MQDIINLVRLKLVNLDLNWTTRRSGLALNRLYIDLKVKNKFIKEW